MNEEKKPLLRPYQIETLRRFKESPYWKSHSSEAVEDAKLMSKPTNGLSDDTIHARQVGKTLEPPHVELKGGTSMQETINALRKAGFKVAGPNRAARRRAKKGGK
jgi:hypothetical protein